MRSGSYATLCLQDSEIVKETNLKDDVMRSWTSLGVLSDMGTRLGVNEKTVLERGVRRSPAMQPRAATATSPPLLFGHQVLG